MATLDVLDNTGEKVSQADLSDAIFDVPVKSSVLHEVVKMQLAKFQSFPQPVLMSLRELVKC